LSIDNRQRLRYSTGINAHFRALFACEDPTMSRAAKSLFVFGVYLLGLSGLLLLIPNWLIGLFGIAPTSEVWIRVVGMLVLFLAVYYIQAARNELIAFAHWSVYVRASVIGFFGLFVLLDLAPAALILFAVVDLAGAAWTWLALRQDAQQPTARSIRPGTP
jgi:hypothetical protein